MPKNKSFHPNLIIVDHFDEVKNQIDIKTETLLDNQCLDEQQRNALNELRQKQVEKIEEAQNKNLSKVNYDEEAFKLKWSHVINDRRLSFERKIEILKVELILIDCVLIEDNSFLSQISLWIMPMFYNEGHLKFFR